MFSVADLKLYLQLSPNYFDSIDMPINIKMLSKCTPFGKRFNHLCAPISVSVGIMQWNTEFRYLGVTGIANKKIKTNFSESWRTFSGCFNAIYERIGNKNNISTALASLTSICLQIWLLYCAKFLMSELCQISSNFNNFW